MDDTTRQTNFVIAELKRERDEAARAVPRRARLTAAASQRNKTDSRVKKAWQDDKRPEHNRATDISKKLDLSESLVRESINRQGLRSKKKQR